MIRWCLQIQIISFYLSIRHNRYVFFNSSSYNETRKTLSISSNQVSMPLKNHPFQYLQLMPEFHPHPVLPSASQSLHFHNPSTALPGRNNGWRDCLVLSILTGKSNITTFLITHICHIFSRNTKNV